MQGRRLAAVERLASSYARLRGSPDEPSCVRDPERPLLSCGKLSHDLLQLRHLRVAGILGSEADSIIDAFVAAFDGFSGTEPEFRRPLDPHREPLLDRYYGRIIHLAAAPRLPQALAEGWSRSAVQEIYLTQPPGIVIIDDFLTPDALGSLRRFCLDSTVWHRNRYAHGRLGAFFLTGFACPLLAQIAEELREQLPHLIGGRHPLRQLWGFKHPPVLPADSTVHADFAAVNVNFWITPESENDDSNSGGLVIYEADAPADWDFSAYNERPDLIKGFLVEKRVGSRYIHYKQNRAIIFNSDLFHATAGVHFKSDYESRRINITMLYGERALDEHHPGISDRSCSRASAASARPAWRSSAWSHRRR